MIIKDKGRLIVKTQALWGFFVTVPSNLLDSYTLVQRWFG